MVRYTGTRREGVLVDGRPLPNRSPHSQEFQWGYGGSGPAALAASLLQDAVDRGLLPQGAQNHYHAFKWAVVAHLPDEWTLTEADLKRWWQEKTGGERPW